jgi:hypothetical protein
MVKTFGYISTLTQHTLFTELHRQSGYERIRSVGWAPLRL